MQRLTSLLTAPPPGESPSLTAAEGDQAADSGSDGAQQRPRVRRRYRGASPPAQRQRQRSSSGPPSLDSDSDSDSGSLPSLIDDCQVAGEMPDLASASEHGSDMPSLVGDGDGWSSGGEEECGASGAESDMPGLLDGSDAEECDDGGQQGQGLGQGLGQGQGQGQGWQQQGQGQGQGWQQQGQSQGNQYQQQPGAQPAFRLVLQQTPDGMPALSFAPLAPGEATPMGLNIGLQQLMQLEQMLFQGQAWGDGGSEGKQPSAALFPAPGLWDGSSSRACLAADGRRAAAGALGRLLSKRCRGLVGGGSPYGARVPPSTPPPPTHSGCAQSRP
jgi:hypothetical protein